VLPFVSLAGGTAADYRPFTASLPPLTLLSLNIFGKLSFAALFGFDGVAILAGECRSPARAISRSVVIAAPVIALIYILGTASVLAFVRPDEVDLIGPVAQALSVGLGPFGLGAHIASAVILLLLVRELALTSFIFTTNTRLPMVAGWDNLLPAWFTKLHEKHKTPVNSIYFIGAVMLALGFAGLAGVGQQEAFQLLLNTALIFYALTYLALFAIPLFGRRRAVRRPPLWLKVAAVAGLLATVNFVLLSIFPIIEVESWAAFSIKIIFIILTANVAGAALFLFAGNKWRWRGVAPAAEEATHAARQR
jgi:amino acid transporter